MTHEMKHVSDCLATSIEGVFESVVVIVAEKAFFLLNVALLRKVIDQPKFVDFASFILCLCNRSAS